MKAFGRDAKVAYSRSTGTLCSTIYNAMFMIGFYVCSEHQIRVCKSWIEAADKYPCTGIHIPNQSALTSLAGLLTGEYTYPATLLDGKTYPIYCLNASISNAINSITHDELVDISVQWAALSPWSEMDINPFDLSGFLTHLKSLWCESNEPQKAIFFWIEDKTA